MTHISKVTGIIVPLFTEEVSLASELFSPATGCFVTSWGQSSEWSWKVPTFSFPIAHEAGPRGRMTWKIVEVGEDPSLPGILEAAGVHLFKDASTNKAGAIKFEIP